MIFEEIPKGIYFNNIKYDIENCVQESETNFRVSKSTTEEELKFGLNYLMVSYFV